MSLRYAHLFMQARQFGFVCSFLGLVTLTATILRDIVFNAGFDQPTRVPLALLIPGIMVVGVGILSASRMPIMDKLSCGRVAFWHLVLQFLILVLASVLLSLTAQNSTPDANYQAVLRNLIGFRALHSALSIRTLQLLAPSAVLGMIMVAIVAGDPPLGIAVVWSWLLQSGDDHSASLVAMGFAAFALLKLAIGHATGLVSHKHKQDGVY